MLISFFNFYKNASTLEYRSVQYRVYMTVHKKIVLEINYLMKSLEFCLISSSSWTSKVMPFKYTLTNSRVSHSHCQVPPLYVNCLSDRKTFLLCCSFQIFSYFFLFFWDVAWGHLWNMHEKWPLCLYMPVCVCVYVYVWIDA